MAEDLAEEGVAVGKVFPRGVNLVYMETNQPFVPPVEKQVNPPQYSPSKRPLLLLLLAIIIILAGLLFYVSPKAQVSTQLTTQPTVKPTLFISQPVVSATLASQKQSLIIYLKESNIWSVTTDGTSLRQLTRDGDNNTVRYQALAFKGKDKIGFARCTGVDIKCEIVSKNLTTGEEKVEFNSQENVASIVWDSKENQLSYIGSNEEGVTALIIVNGEIPKKAIMFESALGRGGGLDDEISLQYSPDDNYLIAVNTGTQPNLANNETTIWIVNKNGEIQSSVSKKMSTDAFWDSPTSIIYRNGDAIYRKTVTGTETQLGSVDGVDTLFSGDKKNIIFWSINDDGTTLIKSFSLDSKTSTQLTSNIVFPKSADENLLIGIKSEPNSESYLGFSTKGLVSYNISTSTEHSLDSNTSISRFIIQN